MKSGTTFYFVTNSLQDALTHAARPLKEKISGLAAESPQSENTFAPDSSNEMHLADAAVLLGSGECLLAGMDLPALGYQVDAHRNSETCLRVTIAKKGV